MAELANPWVVLEAARSAARTLAGSSSQPATDCKIISAGTSNAYANSSDSSNSSRWSRELSQTSDENPKERRRSSNIYISKAYTVPEGVGQAATFGVDGADALTPARVAILLERDLSVSENNEIADSDAARVFRAESSVPSPTDHLRAPQEWRDGFAQLSLHSAPCPGFLQTLARSEWAEVYANIDHFLTYYGEQAFRFGWSARDLFGVDPVVGARRPDRCGALIVCCGNRTTGLSVDTVVFGGKLTFRRSAEAARVPVWEFRGAAT